MAVGSFGLAEAWNGTSWAIQGTQTPAGATYGMLDGVSCTAASACTAAGYSNNENNALSPDTTLAERYS
jgi:hypothetical protein